MPNSSSPLLQSTLTAAAIAFIGGGNMSRSLIGGLLRGGADAGTIHVAEPDPGVGRQLEADFGVRVFAEGAAAATGAGIVVLSVKPQVMRSVCESIAPSLDKDHVLVVSVAAGVRIEQIDAWLGGGFPIVRCMPNTPALIGAGATGMHANSRAGAAQRAQAESILSSSGLTVWIAREELMDTVTGISGSGPAYFLLLIEALEDAAVAQGLPRETARALAIQTCLGAARLAAGTDEAPARLRERVTSPGGTTQAALDAFAEGGLRELVARAVAAATTRGRELAREPG
jgi:pyrroline-5-carboxylate reductase